MSCLLVECQTPLENFGFEQVMHWAVKTGGSDLAFAPSWSDEDLVIQSFFEWKADSVPVVERIQHLLLPETWPKLKTHEAARPSFDGRSTSAEIWARFHLEHLCKMHEAIIRRYTIWIVSARREQDENLAEMPVLSWNERFGILRIAPLAAWSRERIARKIKTVSSQRNRELCSQAGAHSW